MSRSKPLTRRQRQLLRDAYEHALARAPSFVAGEPYAAWAALFSPCPRIGDLRALSGLAVRGLVVPGDRTESDPVAPITVWPRSHRITRLGIEVACGLWPEMKT